MNYLDEFPIDADLLPARLKKLLEPVGTDPKHKVEVAACVEIDQYGPAQEYLHMFVAAVPEAELENVGIFEEASSGVVSYSKPDVGEKGGLSEWRPSASGYDYIVACWGDSLFYSYGLAENVWMSLGLSPRCIGGEGQKIRYDDLSLPEFGVAEGEISRDHCSSSKRDISWTISNEFLRRYLWMRGAHGVRVFYYKKLLADEPHLRALMNGNSQARIKPDGGWYELDIRELEHTHTDGLLLQIWASVPVVEPELCPELTADGILWPDDAEPMTRERADALIDYTPVYLDDRFLERYEQNKLFNTTPVKLGDRWSCSPSYGGQCGGQWSFTDCTRVGRNLIKVPMRELYKPKPDREILHAHKHAVDTATLSQINLDEEHIVSKTGRLVSELLDLGDSLSILSAGLGFQMASEEIVGFSRHELDANGWLHYPKLSHLAQVAPLSMPQQAFLARCKNIHELWQKIPNAFLRNFVVCAGHNRKKVNGLASLKLLEALTNILERLNRDGENLEAFGSDADVNDLKTRNVEIGPLFINNELRKSYAHDDNSNVLNDLESLGFDIALLNDGYGEAMDFVFDKAISAFSHLNAELSKFLNQ